MSIYEYVLKRRDWSDFFLSEYKWKVIIIVNTATWCWFTPQYEWLENLYKKYHEKWLEIIDLPCNQFWHQAPGDDNEIHSFCVAKYNTSFDQFSKIDVNGENESPLYTFLKSQIKDDIIDWLKNRAIMAAVKLKSTTCKNEWDIVWNFTKFLVGREWNVMKRYDPTFKPQEMEEEIEKLLA